MVLPKRDIEAAIAVLKRIKEKRYKRIVHMARDAGISISWMYQIIEYGQRPRPGGEIEAKILDFVDKLKQKYPEDCPQEVTPK